MSSGVVQVLCYRESVSELFGMVRRLRQEPGLSRNRHFDEMSKPEVVRARRVLRRLSGIERELSSASSVAVRPAGGGYLVTIDFAAVRARREAFLTGEEHELLRESEAVGHHFGSTPGACFGPSAA